MVNNAVLIEPTTAVASNNKQFTRWTEGGCYPRQYVKDRIACALWCTRLMASIYEVGSSRYAAGSDGRHQDSAVEAGVALPGR